MAGSNGFPQRACLCKKVWSSTYHSCPCARNCHCLSYFIGESCKPMTCLLDDIRFPSECRLQSQDARQNQWLLCGTFRDAIQLADNLSQFLLLVLHCSQNRGSFDGLFRASSSSAGLRVQSNHSLHSAVSDGTAESQPSFSRLPFAGRHFEAPADLGLSFPGPRPSFPFQWPLLVRCDGPQRHRLHSVKVGPNVFKFLHVRNICSDLNGSLAHSF